MRVLVVFHIYYTHLVDYYLQKMENIHSCEWDLAVTGTNLDEQVLAKIRSFKPGFTYCNTANAGYDIWPFIQCIKQCNLDDYDIVIKLHTKNEDNVQSCHHHKMVNGEGWKRLMVEPMLGSKEHFSTLLRAFRRKSTGLAYAREVDCFCNGRNFEDRGMLTREIERLGIRRRSERFCSGTMFAVRSCALKFLQSDLITEEIFHLEKAQKSHMNSTMAHVYERLIPIAVLGQGYRYAPLYPDRKTRRDFILRDVFNMDRMGPARRKYLFMLGLEIPVSRGCLPACANEPVIVTAVQDDESFARCICGGRYTDTFCRFHKVDNKELKLPEAVIYNRYLETLVADDDFWVVFCPDNWEPRRNVLFFSDTLDKSKIYLPESGHGLTLMVHASQAHSLRFDETLDARAAIEDFCAKASSEHGIAVCKASKL